MPKIVIEWKITWTQYQRWHWKSALGCPIQLVRSTEPVYDHFMLSQYCLQLNIIIVHGVCIITIIFIRSPAQLVIPSSSAEICHHCQRDHNVFVIKIICTDIHVVVQGLLWEAIPRCPPLGQDFLRPRKMSLRKDLLARISWDLEKSSKVRRAVFIRWSGILMVAEATRAKPSTERQDLKLMPRSRP